MEGRDIVAFDALGRAGQVQRALQLLDGLAGRIAFGLDGVGCLQGAQGFGGVADRHIHQIAFAAALRHLDLHSRAALIGQPALDDLAFVDMFWQDDLSPATCPVES